MILPTIFISKFITILKSLLGLSCIVVVHEFGHFLFCKLFKIKTPTFSIGMGPAMFKKKLGETTFQLSTLPLGGYVEIYTDESNASAPGNFNSLYYPQKLLILLGGIIFNILSACIILAAINFFAGKPTTTLKSINIENIEEYSICKDKLFKNDLIVGLNDTFFEQTNFLPDQFKETVVKSKGSNLQFLIQRKTISSTTDSEEEKKIIKVNLVIPNSEKEFGILGLNLQPNTTTFFEKKLPIYKSVSLAVETAITDFVESMHAFKVIFSKNILKSIAGPIMIIKESNKSSEDGFINFLLFLCMFSLRLAAMNILPLGILDGGRIFTVTLEALTRRSLPLLTITINITSFILLFGLTIYLAIKEILQIFFS